MSRIRHYAWEAAHLAPNARVHAVGVATDEDAEHDFRRGDRNTETLCHRPVGTRYRRIVWRETVRRQPHVQLHRAADLAGLGRCGICLAVLSSGWYRSIGVEFVEWGEDRTPFPGRALPAVPPCPAYHRTYYRYQAAVPGGYWVPEEEWLALEGRGEWHADPEREDRQACQREVNRRRLEEIRRRLTAFQNGETEALQADVAAWATLEERLGEDAARALAESGHIDVPSGFLPGIGYRVRGWRRVGVLHRDGDGWRELDKSLCVHPDELYPMADEVLALVLALRFDEPRVLATANVHMEAAS